MSRSLPLLALALSLSACAAFDPYDGVPIGVYKVGNSPFTLADLAKQDAEQESCIKFVNETTPSSGQMMRAFALNGGVGGLVGGAAGTVASYAIIGVDIGLKSAAAGGVSYMLAAAGVNAGSGNIYRAVLVRAGLNYCLVAAAMGVHSIAPSEVERLRRGEIVEIPVAQLPMSPNVSAERLGAFAPPQLPLF